MVGLLLNETVGTHHSEIWIGTGHIILQNARRKVVCEGATFKSPLMFQIMSPGAISTETSKLASDISDHLIEQLGQQRILHGIIWLHSTNVYKISPSAFFKQVGMLETEWAFRHLYDKNKHVAKSSKREIPDVTEFS